MFGNCIVANVCMIMLIHFVAAGFVAAQNPLREMESERAGISSVEPRPHTQPPIASRLKLQAIFESEQRDSVGFSEVEKTTNWLQDQRLAAQQTRQELIPDGMPHESGAVLQSSDEARVDKYVKQASFERNFETRDPSVAAAGRLPEEKRPSLLRSTALPLDQDLGEMVSRIAINCCFVLAICVGFILLARQWFSRGGKFTASGSDGNKLCVREILKIDSRITLRLVQWRSTDILVSSDTTGIKSVSILNPTFEDNLEEHSETDLLHQIINSLSDKDSKALRSS